MQTSNQAAIYARRSKDLELVGRNVDSQVRDMRSSADRNGDTISDDHIYVDNDVSASRFTKKVRTDWKRLLQAIERGEVRSIYTLWLNRLLRIPNQLEQLIALAIAGKFDRIVTETMPLDLRTPEGQYMARQMAAQAAMEVEQLSTRLKREMNLRREEGRTTCGVVTFGWLGTRHGHTDDLGLLHCEPEAQLLREAAVRVLAGTPLSTIAREWNAAAVPMPMVLHQWVKAGREGDMPASRWMPAHIQRLLTLPRNAGYQVHAGKTIGQPWPAIIDADTYAELVAHFERRKYGPRAARSGRWTGFVRCAGLKEDGTLCGATMLYAPASGKLPGSFSCKAIVGRNCCGHNGVVEHRIEALAYKWITAHLDDKRMVALSKAEGPNAADLYAKLQQLNAAQAENDELRGVGAMTPDAYKRASEANARAVEAVSRDLAKCTGAVQTVMAKYLGRGTFVGAALASGDMEADEHRALFMSTGQYCWVRPQGHRGPFNPERVHFGEAPKREWMKKARDTKREAA